MMILCSILCIWFEVLRFRFGIIVFLFPDCVFLFRISVFACDSVLSFGILFWVFVFLF